MRILVRVTIDDRVEHDSQSTRATCGTGRSPNPTSIATPSSFRQRFAELELEAPLSPFLLENGSAFGFAQTEQPAASP